MRTGRGNPVYGGKVVAVAYNNPQAFVEDHARRQADVRRFFSPSTTAAERRAIVLRYGVSYMLLDRDQADGVTLSPTAIRAIGAVVRDENGLALIRVKPVASAAGV